MLREALALLNTYYYGWMTGKYAEGKLFTDEQIALLLKVIECVRGIYGWQPAMEAYIPEPMRHALLRALEQYIHSQRSIYINPSAFSPSQRTSIDTEEVERRFNAPNFPRILYDIPGSPGHLQKDAHGEICWIGPKREIHNNRKSLARLLLGYGDTSFYINSKTTALRSVDIIPSALPDLALFQGIRQLATYIGMPAHELENLIAWRVKPLTSYEKEALTLQIKLVADQRYKASLTQAEHKRQMDLTEDIWFTNITGARTIPTTAEHGEHKIKVFERTHWQYLESGYFMAWCVWGAGQELQKQPIKTPSGKYDETLKVERTQQDLINEMAMELSSLPRFTAYAKAIEERSGTQLVWKRKIETLALPPERRVRSGDSEAMAVHNSHRFSKERDQIEEEIRQRQEPWRGGGGPGQPPSQPPRKPPPTSTPSNAGEERKPPPPSDVTARNVPEEKSPESRDDVQSSTVTDQSRSVQESQDARIIDFSAFLHNRRQAEEDMQATTPERSVGERSGKTPLIPRHQAALPVEEPTEALELTRPEAERRDAEDESGHAVLHAFMGMLWPMTRGIMSLFPHLEALELQREEDTFWREDRLRALKRYSEKEGGVPYGNGGLLAALLGETAIAERFIHQLVTDTGTTSDIYDFEAGEIALNLPLTVTARRLLRQFEAKGKPDAALHIAVALGERAAVDRLLRQIITHGLPASGVDHLDYIVNSLMKAVLYNPALGKQVVKVVEGLRGVRWVEDDIEYRAYAGKIAAVLGEWGYAKQAMTCCLEQEKYVEAGAIAVLLGEVAAAEDMLVKACQAAKNTLPPPSRLRALLSAIVARNPHAAGRLWKTVTERYPEHVGILAADVLAHLYRPEF